MKRRIFGYAMGSGEDYRLSGNYPDNRVLSGLATTRQRRGFNLRWGSLLRRQRLTLQRQPFGFRFLAPIDLRELFSRL